MKLFHLGVEARKHDPGIIEFLVQVYKGEVRGATVRDRLTAVTMLLDRGHGKPPQQVSVQMLDKKLNELAPSELVTFSEQLASMIDAEQQQPRALSRGRGIPTGRHLDERVGRADATAGDAPDVGISRRRKLQGEAA